MNNAAEITTEYIEIRRDNEYVTTVHNQNVLAWFHHEHSYSMDHALQFEGYSVHPVPERWVFFTKDRDEQGNWMPEVVTPKISQRAAKMAYNRHTGTEAEYGYRIERRHNGTWMAV